MLGKPEHKMSGGQRTPECGGCRRKQRRKEERTRNRREQPAPMRGSLRASVSTQRVLRTHRSAGLAARGPFERCTQQGSSIDWPPFEEPSAKSLYNGCETEKQSPHRLLPHLKIVSACKLLYTKGYKRQATNGKISTMFRKSTVKGAALAKSQTPRSATAFARPR